MGQALECAECDVVASLLIVIPGLYKMAAPSCGFHGELEADAELELIPINSPEAEGFTVLRGFVVPRSGG